jgi:hypothetical protein
MEHQWGYIQWVYDYNCDGDFVPLKTYGTSMADFTMNKRSLSLSLYIYRQSCFNYQRQMWLIFVVPNYIIWMDALMGWLMVGIIGLSMTILWG